MDIYTATEEAYKNGYAKAKAEFYREGKWIKSDFFGKPYCSNCSTYSDETPFCPYCGSKNLIDF